MKKQKVMSQMKEQDKTQEKQLNEVEIGNLPEKEFRIMIVKMVQNLGKRMEAKIGEMQEMFTKDLEELKNKQTEMTNLPGSVVHGILQARILEWVAYPFSSASSWSRNQNWVSCTADGFFTNWAIRASQMMEQDKTSEKQLNEVETGNLPEKEFRIMIANMIYDLGKGKEATIETMQEMFTKDLQELKNRDE